MIEEFSPVLHRLWNDAFPDSPFDYLVDIKFVRENAAQLIDEIQRIASEADISK